MTHMKDKIAELNGPARRKRANAFVSKTESHILGLASVCDLSPQHGPFYDNIQQLQ